MATELKTKVNNASVDKFLDSVANETRRDDARAVLQLMKQITREEPKMWGTSIVGFGSFTYKYASGQQGDWPIAAFSPRKQNLVLYIMNGFDGYKELIGKLGKHKIGKSCLYLNTLDQVDQKVLKEMVKRSVAYMRDKYKKKRG